MQCIFIGENDTNVGVYLLASRQLRHFLLYLLVVVPN